MEWVSAAKEENDHKTVTLANEAVRLVELDWLGDVERPASGGSAR